MQQNVFNQFDNPSQLPPQPQPFPGAVPMSAPLVNPRHSIQDEATQERLRLAQEAAARAAEQLAISQGKAALDVEEAERKRAKAAATGGVDTTEAENTAAFLATQLAGHARKIDEVLKNHPDAVKPGWPETLAEPFGPRFKTLIMGADKVQALTDARNILNNRYAGAAEAIIRLGTGAAYTEIERKTAIENLAPKVTDGPEVLADKKQQMIEAIIAAKTKAGAAAGQVDRALAEIEKLYGVEVPETTKEGEKSLTTETKVGKLPEGYLEDHAALFGNFKKGEMTPQDYIRIRQQLAGIHGGWGQGLSEAEAKEVTDFYNATGKVPRPVAEDIPLSQKEQEAAEFASSELGTGAMNFTNAMTLGAVDLLAGQEGRKAKDLANEENWKSALAGEVLGSVAPMGAIERAGIKSLEKLGMSPAKIAELAPRIFGKEMRITGGRGRLASDIATNMVYGGARGFAGADEGEGLSGTLTGMTAGAAGAGLGNLAVKGTTPLLSDATALALESTKGIKRTTLQRLGLGKAEASLSGVPGTHGAREASFQSFHRDLAQRALNNVGIKLPKKMKDSAEINAFVNQELSNAYNVIRPKIVGAADGQFDGNLKLLKAAKANTTEKKNMFKEIEAAKNMFIDPTTGHYTGQGYKEASERLRFLAKTWRDTEGSVAAQDMAKVAEQARKEMQFLIQRQTPEVGKELKSLERAWKHKIIIEDASERAAAANELTPSPSQYVTSIKKFSEPGHVARGKGFDQDYAMAAQKVLGPGGIPKLSPLQTSMVLGVVGGGGGAVVSPIIPATMGAIAMGLYGPGAKQIIQKILAGKRPTAADNEIIRRILEDASRNQMTGD